MSRAPAEVRGSETADAPPAPGGVGSTRTQRVVVATPGDPLQLAGGRTLDHVEVAYETYGELNAAGDNAVYLCHALTAGAHAAGVDAETGALGWWDALIGPGRAIDTGRWFVVCGNLLGSCLGTTGPASVDPVTGQPHGLAFPPITVADQVAVHRRLLAALGVQRVHALVGPSIGGMQALQWLLDAPEDVGRTLLIATTGKLTTENRAFSAAGRQAILDDPGFDGGRYLERGGPGPVRGLAAARRFAHITYVASGALDDKLGDDPPPGWPPREAAEWLAPSRAVETYLAHQGTSFTDRFDALSYLFLTRPMDDFDPFHPSREVDVTDALVRHAAAVGGRAVEAAGAIRHSASSGSIGAPRHTIISFDSDWRFGTDHSIRLEAELRAHGAAGVVRYELSAPWGHDSFLLDAPGLPELIAQALAA